MTKKTAATEFLAQAKPASKGIWPNGYESPTVILVGEPGTGKSAFFPLMLLDHPEMRMTALDMEGSYADLKRIPGLEVIDVRALARKRFLAENPDRLPFEYTDLDLFEAFLEAAFALPGGDVLIIDPISKLHIGSNAYVKKRPDLAMKTGYAGKDGNIFSWGDTDVLWGRIFGALEERFKTIAITAHPRDIIRDGVRTGEQRVKGRDFTEWSTLMLWLARDPLDGRSKKLQSGRPGGFWAIVKRQRFSAHALSANGVRTGGVLPVLLIPEQGQPYHQLIEHYMQNPRADWGDLDKPEVDPALHIIGEIEKEQMEQARLQALAEKAAADAEAALRQWKTKFAQELMAAGFTSPVQIGQALREIGESYTIERHHELLALCVEWLKTHEQQPGS